MGPFPAPPFVEVSWSVSEAYPEAELNDTRSVGEPARILFLLHPAGILIVKIQAAKAGPETAIGAHTTIVEKIENIEVWFDREIVDHVRVLNLDRPGYP